MKRVLAAFARNTVFANILLLLIFLSGGFAVKSMIREFFPEFSLDMVTVTVPYPGADPEEVEEGISRKIEEAVDGLEGVKQYTTKSAEGVATAMIEVKEDYETSEVLDRVRSKIDAVSTFPVDAEKPIVTELTLKESIMVIALFGDMSERRLKEWAERVKDEMQQIPEVSKVSVFGARDYEIAIEISEEKLREYGLTFSQVVGAVRRSNLNLAGGTIRTEGEEIRVRTVGRKYYGEDMAKIVVLARPEGEIITLDRIAKINDGFTQDPVSATVNGDRAVLLNVFKSKEEDALTITHAVQKYVDRKKHEIPEGAAVKVIYQTTDMLKARIDLLVKNGVIGLCLVFILLWLFLDLRLSFWAGMGIPISLAGGLVVLWSIGGTINMISLFGLIMVLGIVVDDAIVVGEAIFHRRKEGDSPLQAAVEGVCEVGMPVVAAVTTSVVAFLPLAYIGGVMGKFISILPMVVIACLAVSLVECLVLLPAHLSHLPDPNQPDDRLTRRLKTLNRLCARLLAWFTQRVYAPFARKALRWRYVSFCTAIAVLMLTIGFVRSGIVKFEVFSEIDGFIVTANVEFPNGTPPETVQKALKQIDDALTRLAAKTETRSGEPLVVDRLSIAGETIGDMPEQGPHLGGMIVTLLDSEQRGVHSKDIMAAWEKETGTIPGIKSLTFAGMAHGPPGAPIEIWLQGHQMDDILSAADDLMKKLDHYEGVYQIRSDFSPGKNEIRLSLKPEARTLGVTVEDLARQVYAGYYGEEALRLQRGRDDIRVKIRYTEDERSRLSELDRVRIRTPAGYEVPLASVADFSFAPGYATITRTDGLRRVAVSADVDTNKANANEIIEDLQGAFFAGMKTDHPGVYVSVEGEKKKMRESFSSLFVGYPMAMIGIFIIIATMFRSYIQPLVIMFTIPFGVIGAIAGHLVMGYDLSLMSVFGIVALTGVVVNDAIVLIERINENLADGMPFFDAVHNGGVRRFRAIFLTTISTVGGLAPLIMETDFQARFLIPMALSIAAGVIFATVLTLVLIPSLLVILNDLRRIMRRLNRGYWPAREEVEPATKRREQESDVEKIARPAPLSHFMVLEADDAPPQKARSAAG